MTENTQNNNYRAGYISIIGKPNAGKSTLLNKFLVQKIAAVSPRTQNNRKNQNINKTKKEKNKIN
jgi:GTP-binding protein Era